MSFLLVTVVSYYFSPSVSFEYTVSVIIFFIIYISYFFLYSSLPSSLRKGKYLYEIMYLRLYVYMCVCLYVARVCIFPPVH